MPDIIVSAAFPHGVMLNKFSRTSSFHSEATPSNALFLQLSEHFDFMAGLSGQSLMDSVLIFMFPKDL